MPTKPTKVGVMAIVSKINLHERTLLSVHIKYNLCLSNFVYTRHLFSLVPFGPKTKFL